MKESAADAPSAAERGHYLGLSRQRVATLRDSRVIHGLMLADQVRSYCESLREQARGGDSVGTLAHERALLARRGARRVEGVSLARPFRRAERPCAGVDNPYNFVASRTRRQVSIRTSSV